ncbi:MAG: histidine triad nucleotide-binding protein [Euzebyales bacterium]|nr:histidine triad nucleotide-binding protein [Euzebyales bacterium]
MPTDCLFCRIVAGEVPSDQVHADDQVVVFRDIAPRAPVHVLVVPREHIPSLHDVDGSHDQLMLRALDVARQVAEAEGIADGYRLTTNIGTRGGQAIAHLHFHVLGGRQLAHIDSGEPPASD